jgi:phosphoribosylanthranilate isomerase
MKNNPKVKICGITNIGDALGSIDAGCDALGFVFYKKSLRYISPDRAVEIIKQLPPHIIKIGIFVNAKEKTIKHIARICDLDILQFHGNESPEFCRRFNGYKIIKAFRINKNLDLEKILRYKVFAYLFDTLVESKFGGTGKKFNWKLVRHIDDLKSPVFLSGGLNAENVKEAVEAVQPHWVDVSSSVEIKPGKKDHKKVRKFIKRAKGTVPKRFL